MKVEFEEYSELCRMITQEINRITAVTEDQARVMPVTAQEGIRTSGAMLLVEAAEILQRFAVWKDAHLLASDCRAGSAKLREAFRSIQMRAREVARELDTRAEEA